MLPVITVENLSKKYIIGHQKQERYTALRDVLANGAKHFTHKLIHPFAPPKSDPDHEEFWALRDISFDIQQGDRVGIIGRNGAGKSTLLKILSRITEPTSGRISIKGRVASLLEVGTGFHPELTGRENIFLNGAILGMRRAEIKNKFEEIVDFAEVERFLDTPVKRYSSGMYVRLAFAVAAYLEPEVLIVDEVLAVGDAQFQKKCMGKMQDVGKEGRTVLFVSHNMGAVKTLCGQAIWLSNGLVLANGNVTDVVEKYLSDGQVSTDGGEILWSDIDAPECDELSLQSIRLLGSNGMCQSIFSASDSIDIEIKYCAKKPIRGMRIILSVATNEGVIAFASTNHNTNNDSELISGEHTSRCRIPSLLLNSGHYLIGIHFGIPGVKVLIPGHEYIAMTIQATGTHGSNFTEEWPGVVAPALQWSTQ